MPPPYFGRLSGKKSKGRDFQGFRLIVNDLNLFFPMLKRIYLNLNPGHSGLEIRRRLMPSWLKRQEADNREGLSAS